MIERFRNITVLYYSFAVPGINNKFAYQGISNKFAYQGIKQ
jgi:hypothetical protein